jgi:FlaA1/EpsC-like NDP-sugar epimerase
MKITGMARRMITMFGKAVEIVFTGLRHGEGLHEVRLGDGNGGERPLHPMISHVLVPALDPDDIEIHPWARAAAGAPRLGSALRYEISVT